MGGVCTVIFMSNPTVVLCCVGVGVLTIEEIIKIKGEREKNQPTFVLWITRPPMSLEFFCTFSNSPIHTNK